MTFTFLHSTRAGHAPRRVRRRPLAIALTLSLALTAAACGSDTSGEADGGGSPSAEEQALAESGGDATTTTTEAPDVTFPLEVDHVYGTTELTEVPERIVVVGLNEQDALLALGVVPVATTEWFGGYDGAVWPWAQDELEELGGEEITLLTDTDGVQFEKVAAARPDLILGLYSGMTEEVYDTLSGIAPTVAQPDGVPSFGISWQETTRTVGRILDKADEAEALVADVEGQIAAAAEAHPELAGVTTVIAAPYDGIYVYGPSDPRWLLVEALGLDVPDEIEALATEEFGFSLSSEKAGVLDVDVVVWLDPEEAEGPLGGPVYQGLDVHDEGREVLLDSEGDPELGGAMSFQTVLSLPGLIERLVPSLSAAADGDPATEVPAP